MIERNYLQITGPAGEGKTTLMTRVLAARKGLVRVARCVLTNAPGFHVTDQSDDAELRRYRNAGASRPVRLSFDLEARAANAFWGSTFLHEYYQNAIFEGPMPFSGRPDLCVFVCRPPDTPLLLRDDGEAELALQAMRDDPDALANVLRSFLPAGVAENIDVRALVAQQLAQPTMRRSPSKPRWRLADGYQELVHSKVVIFNVHSDEERALAAQRTEEIERIRNDPEVRDALLGWGGDRRPVTIRTVDLRSERGTPVTSLLKRITRELR